jgi:hypothetical protein
VTAPTVDLNFQHHWQAEILPARPAILPTRRFVYPRDAEEVERSALEVLVRPQAPGEIAVRVQPFLATCALGFRDPAVPTGLWAAPNPREICAVSGGYAYIIDTADPEHFTMIQFRPVLEVLALAREELLVFVGHQSVLAWGADGLAWETGKLSDEGVTITRIESGVLYGMGWEMMTDREKAFAVDLRTGQIRE